jgi:hypothetical protein
MEIVGGQDKNIHSTKRGLSGAPGMTILRLAGSMGTGMARVPTAINPEIKRKSSPELMLRKTGAITDETSSARNLVAGTLCHYYWLLIV